MNAPKAASSALKLKIRYQSPQALSVLPGAARTHSSKKIGKMAAAIDRWGMLSPLVVDEGNQVIAGVARLKAALLNGDKQVPTICLTHMTEADKRAYRIAENRLCELAGWDKRALATELQTILQIDPGFDIQLTGFEVEEVEVFIDALSTFDCARDDELSDVQKNVGPAVSRLGDLWGMGDQLLLCGDALSWESYASLLGRNRAAMIIADAPFNVRIKGHVSGKGKIQHREFVQGSGEMSDAEFTTFLLAAARHAARASRDGSLHYWFIDWAHLYELQTACRAVYDELKNIVCWAKSHGGMGAFYRSRHELITIYKKGSAPHTNNIMLGTNGRDRSNVWEYPGMNSFSATRDEELALHPTIKPLALIADAILDASNRGDIILDPFGGSGTTILAAEQTGRKGRTIELDPLYCDVILRRFEKKTGITPILSGTGQTFSDVARARSLEANHG